MFLGWARSRWITYAAMLALTVLVSVITVALKPNVRPVHAATLASGYASLIILAITLGLGTWNLWRKRIRRNPVNLYVRRDVGLWCAYTGIAHVIFGFQVHLGGDILAYFFEDGQLRGDPFGIANSTGLIGALVLIALLVLSNDWSMRLLKGARWKWLQRLNYLLFAFVLAHTLVYQQVVSRESIMPVLVIALTVIVLIAQVIGFRIMRSRAQATGALNP